MIDWATYRRAVAAVVARTVVEPVDPAVLATVALGVPVRQAVLGAARAVDRVVAPGVRGQPVRAPVFVVGHPRSGTTFLHRLLALDERFSTPRAWQLVLPAVSLYRLGGLAGRSRAGRALAARLHRRLLEPVAGVHPTAWTAPEEDDWLFVLAAASPTVAVATARPSIGRRYGIGDNLPAGERERFMRWYRRLVRQHLYATGGTATYLSKNPRFTGWLRTLLASFPDARFVMLVRDPAEAIASRLDLLSKAWLLSRPRGDPRLEDELHASQRLYRHAEQVWPELPEARRIRVPYPGLVTDPVATLQRIYRHFDWTIGPDLAKAWDDAAAAARRRIPRAPIPLRRFGFRRREVVEALRDLEALWATLGEAP